MTIETWALFLHPRPSTGTLGTEVKEIGEKPHLIYASIYRGGIRTFRAVQFRRPENTIEWSRREPLL